MKIEKSLPGLICLFSLLALTAEVNAQEQNPKGERKNQMQAFNQRHRNQWRIHWNEATGTPASILGHRITSYSGTPLEITLGFLRDEKEMLGIADVERDLDLIRTNYSDRGGTRLAFTQKYQDVPILASGYLVAVDDDGSIYFVSGDYYPEVSLETTPSLSPSEAIFAVQNDLSGVQIDSLHGPTLAIQAEVNMSKEEYLLVYNVEAYVDGDMTGAWRYTIDASNGDIIDRKDLIERVNGSGYVYDTNPLHGSTVTRTIHRLRNISPRRLDGDNVIVYNDKAAEASDPNGQFFYSPTNTHFDEVMSYYHSDEFEAWLIGKGMGTGRVGKVTVYAHNTHTDIYGNPFYAASNSSSRIIYLSDGIGWSALNDPAKEAAVITHEYMHVVSETYNSLTQGDEAEAMDESYSDYFGVAYTNQWYSDATIGEYIDVAGGPVYRRELMNNRTYSEIDTIDLEPNGATDEHDRSVIFSGALWDFRRDSNVSSSIADELVLESLNNLGTNPTFLQGRVALEAAATASGYSSYLDDIADAFFAHGIFPPPTVTISGPIDLDVGEYGIWTANASGGTGSYTYQWYYRSEDTNNQWISLVTSSTYTTRMYDFDKYLDLKVNVTSGGEVASDTHYVFCNDCSPGGGPLKGIAGELTEPIPETFALNSAYPNPFNSVTTIEYALPEPSQVHLVIYDLAGRTVATLVSGFVDAGYGAAVWQGRDGSGRPVPTGVYIYRIIATGLDSGERITQTRKMVLLK